MRKSTHVMLVVSLASFFAGQSVSTMAQQPGGAAAGALIDGTTGAVDADAEYKATILTYQSDQLVAQHQYYWWHGKCYVRYPSGNFASVPPGTCSQIQ
jgi:hypothetical protein